MSALDACWYHMESPTTPMMVTGVIALGGELPFGTLLDLVQTRMVDRFPRFRDRVVAPWLGVGRPRWGRDPHFDLRRHVHRVALPDPGGRRELAAMVGDWMGLPLDLSRAPWEIHLVEGVEGGAALVARVHHCVADGISMARVLLSLADARADERAIPTRTGLARRSTALTTRLAQVTGSAVALIRLPFDPPTPLRGPLSTRRVCAWSDPIDLEAVKAIGRRTQTSVNDVLTSALAGALRAWLRARGSEVPHLRVFVPVNVRPLDVEVRPTLGNQFSIVLLQLPVGQADPARRLASVHEGMAAVKAGRDAEVVYAMLHVLGAIPAPVERRIVRILGRKGTALVTNVPGPREPLSMGGVPVTQVLSWVPQVGALGVGVSIFSYAGRIVVGVAADAGIVSDPAEIADQIAPEIAALADVSAPA